MHTSFERYTGVHVPNSIIYVLALFIDISSRALYTECQSESDLFNDGKKAVRPWTVINYYL